MFPHDGIVPRNSFLPVEGYYGNCSLMKGPPDASRPSLGPCLRTSAAALCDANRRRLIPQGSQGAQGRSGTPARELANQHIRQRGCPPVTSGLEARSLGGPCPPERAALTPPSRPPRFCPERGPIFPLALWRRRELVVPPCSLTARGAGGAAGALAGLQSRRRIPPFGTRRGPPSQSPGWRNKMRHGRLGRQAEEGRSGVPG